jgi:signal transduction histidine kinase
MADDNGAVGAHADAKPATASEPDTVRALIPLFALIFTGLALVAEPAGWWQAVVLLGAVGLFAAWSHWRLPTPILSAGVLTAVIVVQFEPHLEPATFLACLLAIAVARWSPVGPVSIGTLIVILAAPIVIATQRGDGYGWPIWIIALLFTIALAWALRRQQALAVALDQARDELAQAAVREERRQMARDVHDLVGHGLAAILVQVTSARHVLTRNPTAADEALSTAENVGRQSMQELRRTVALLRQGDESGLDAPLPGLADLGTLVDAARDRGLDVSYHAEGGVDTVDPAIGLALHRITQEALANAGRHAPHARTVVTATVTEDDVVLDVESLGATTGRSDGAAHFGLQGMRERADIVGGEFRAGPSPSGWTVWCRVPRRAPR